MKDRNNGNAIATELIRTICYFISYRIDDILDSVYVPRYKLCSIIFTSVCFGIM